MCNTHIALWFIDSLTIDVEYYYEFQSSWQTEGRKEETKCGACCTKYGRAPNLAVLDDGAVNVATSLILLLAPAQLDDIESRIAAAASVRPPAHVKVLLWIVNVMFRLQQFQQLQATYVQYSTVHHQVDVVRV